MEKFLITLTGAQSQTRGGKKYEKNIPVTTDDPFEIAYARSRPEFTVVGVPKPKPTATAKSVRAQEPKPEPEPEEEPIAEEPPEPEPQPDEGKPKVSSKKRVRL